MTPTLAQLTSKYAFLCVGRLPFTSASVATSFLLDRPLIVPFWPELPNIGSAELMLERAKKAQDNGSKGYGESEAAGLFALKNKLCAASARLPLLKGQVAGPLTCLRLLGQTSSVNRLEEFAEVALRQVLWQAQFVSEFADNFLVVLDEPALTFWPQLSESDRAIICDVYEQILKKLQSKGVFVGVHSCKSISPEILDVSFDLYSFEWTMPEENVELLAQSFLNASSRGAVFAPGVVPAVWGNEPNLGILEGAQAAQRVQAWFSEVSSPYDFGSELKGGLNVLWAATCGHAFASPSWVTALYTQDHLDAINGCLSGASARP